MDIFKIEENKTLVIYQYTQLESRCSIECTQFLEKAIKAVTHSDEKLL